MYIFIKNFFPQKKFWIFRLFSSTFYMFNFFLLQGWFIAERAKFSLFAALPLGLLVLYKTFSREYSLLKGAVLFSFIFFFLNGGGSPANYGAIILVYLLAFFYLTLTNFIKGGLREIFFSIKTAILFFVGFLLINAYWVLPQVYLAKTGFGEKLASTGGVEGVLAWERTVNISANFANLFRLQGIPDWYSGEHPYSSYFIENPLLILLSFIPAIVIFLGLFYHRRFEKSVRMERLFYLMLLIFLVGAVFTAGSRSPLGFVYLFLVRYVPGFAIFRTAFYKFAPAFWFTFIFLAGYYLNLFILKFVKKKAIFNTIGILVIAFILAYHFPYFVGNFFAWNKPFSTKVQVPKYVEEMSEYVNSSTEATSRILLLPPLDQNFQNDSYDWGFWSLDPLPRLAMNRSIVANDSDFPLIVSDIYKALEQGDEQSFLYLSGITGVNHILWRDDLLYSNKVTASEDLMFWKENLTKLSGISEILKSGSWELYGLSGSTQPLFYSAKNLIHSTTDPTRISDVLDIVEREDTSSIFFSKSLSGKKLEETSLQFSKKVVGAECILCVPGEFEGRVEAVDIPEVRFLPDSLVYPLILFKEKISMDKVENIPTMKADLYLSLANKRLGEIAGFVRNQDSVPQILVEKNIERYKSHMMDAFKQLDFITPETQKNSYLIKILSYLEAQRKYMISLDEESGVFGSNSFVGLVDFLENNKKALEERVWMTESSLHQKLYFVISEPSSYEIRLKGESDGLEKILIDGSEVKGSSDVELGTDIHKLELVYADPENLAEGMLVFSEEVDLFSGQVRDLELFGLDNRDTYLVTFRYKILRGHAPSLLISGKSTNIKEKLSSNDDWHTFNKVFSPGREEESLSFQFFLPGIGRKTNFIIEDFRVNKFNEPKVYFLSEQEATDLSSPDISFRRKNPTNYLVNVKKAEKPYVLVFGEAFNPGWKVYMGQDGGLLNVFASPLDEERHIEVNGYANAWIVDKVGSYDISVVYWPQTLFKLGVAISTISFIGYLLLILVELRRANKRSHSKQQRI